ncbi:AAA family ATPase [Enterococcus sp. LJL99]
MIIWINGAYGAGKTTIAEILNKKITGSFLYDPENLGDFFRHNLPKSIQKMDFQYYSEWIEWNFYIIEKIYTEYDGDIIIPMTIYEEPAYDLLINRLKNSELSFLHVQLEVDKTEVIARIQERNEELIQWAESKLDQIITNFKKIPREDKISNMSISPNEVADLIIKRARQRNDTF